MKVAVDARELAGRPTGVGRYLAHLMDAWKTLPEARSHDFRLCSPGPGEASGTLWEQLSLPLALRRDRPDVLFAPAYTAPILTGVPVVLTIHDLSFVAHPEWFPPRSRLRRRALATLSARRARLVLTDAQFSVGEIVRLLRVPAKKIRVIPLGLTRPRGDEDAPRAGGATRRSLPGLRPVVLFVGSVFNRRHLPELIHAFASVRARHPELRLEIVGDDRTYPALDLRAAAVAAGVDAAVSIRSYLPDDVLAGLYEEAGAFAFLSDYEGFGLTPLEALQAGVPALVGDTPVAREVYGDAALRVSTTDVPAIAAGLERLLFDAELRERMLGAAPAVLSRYSWERCARETLSALVEAAHA